MIKETAEATEKGWGRSIITEALLALQLFYQRKEADGGRKKV